MSLQRHSVLARPKRRSRANPDQANHQRVLRLMQAAGKPMRAYELLELLKPSGIKAALTVYRALTRLIEDGFVHRLASINAYVVRPADDPPELPAIFAICESCGEVDHVEDESVARYLKAKMTEHGFCIDGAMLEVKGYCAACCVRPSTPRSME